MIGFFFYFRLSPPPAIINKLFILLFHSSKIHANVIFEDYKPGKKNNLAILPMV